MKYASWLKAYTTCAKSCAANVDVGKERRRRERRARMERMERM
jgi:hypothetical protein